MADREPDGKNVTCPACGTTLHRNDAREYDPLGDRWDRTQKSFEYLCKSCYRNECHQPRDGLEETLIRTGGPFSTADAFITAYYQQVAAVSDNE